MTPVIAAILGAIALGLGAFVVLLPLARVIPARLQAQWAIDAEVHARSASDGSGASTYLFSFFERAVLVAVAMALGYLSLTVHGSQSEGAAFAIYFFSLLLLVAINLKHALLPDVVVLSTLWAGLLYHTVTGSAAEHVYGAAVGYMIPFLVALAIKVATGKEAIGFGDLKALSMAGAWFGLAALPVLLGGFVVGVIGWALIARAASRAQRFVATGPAHLIASIAAALSARYL